MDGLVDLQNYICLAWKLWLITIVICDFSSIGVLWRIRQSAELLVILFLELCCCGSLYFVLHKSLQKEHAQLVSLLTGKVLGALSVPE
jgi:hypothetical protein